MQSEEEWKEISLDDQENFRKIQETIAQSLIRIHGDHAHLVALGEMLKDNANQEGWRLVLNFIDEFNRGENDAST
jgi:hypothetical protein